MCNLTTARPAFSIDDVNGMDEAAFTAVFGSLFEHSPWVAAQSWFLRPFSSPADLLAKLISTLRQASGEAQVGLIQAHPDLAGRLAREGGLTRNSSQEQASAGLDQLSFEEIRLFEEYNEIYRTRFGFPFVICARLNDAKTILLAFQSRLQSGRDAEISTALDEIEKIAQLRLASLLRD